jgi:hypothetical protein
MYVLRASPFFPFIETIKIVNIIWGCHTHVPSSNNLWVGDFFYIFFYKINNEDTTMSLRKEKYAYVDGLFLFIYLLKYVKYENYH